MTTASFQFSIDNPRSRIYIGAIHAPLSPALATNVSYVNFDKGVGRVIYNDRPPIPEIFTDPSPYQVYINAWLTAYSTGALPITLAQAQAIKANLTDDIFFVKSRAPVTVTTSLGAYTFNVDPNDPISVTSALAALPALTAVDSAAAAAIAQLVSSINSVIVGGVNGTVVAGINSELNVAAGDVITYLTGGVNSFFASLFNQLLTQFPGQFPTPFPTISVNSFGGGVGTIGSVSASLASPTGLPSAVRMMPVGATSYPAFTVADLLAVLGAAQAQLAAETLVRVTKQAALAALSTVASVISYDATTGW
jgi:hypothetical protein